MMLGPRAYLQSETEPDTVDTFDLENTLRHLLYAAGYNDAGHQNVPWTFDVCLDGRMYTVFVTEWAPDAEARPALSPRELDVAQLIARGLPNKAIAAILELRPSTVNTYTKRIYLKLNVSSRAEMVAKVLREPSRRFYTPQSAGNPS
jgi:DNA-binding NarL/FixJ family response regulator